MRLAVAAAVLLATIPSAASAESRTTIAAADVFMLGGEQTQPIRVEGKNIGSVAVEILGQSGATKTSYARVAPGQAFDQTFKAQEIALVRNLSETREAVVAIKLDRSLMQLSMRYMLPQKD